MKADILSRKDQVDTTNNNKNIKFLKDKLWMKQVKMEAEVIMKSQIVEETILLDKIQRSQMKELGKDDGIVYVKEGIYVPNNKKIQEQVLWENYNLADIGYLK